LCDVIGTITSTIPSTTRKRTLRDFNTRKLSILFASDLVSRGLDIPLLAIVISYDAANSEIDQVHRNGRTARAGRPGKAITFKSAGRANSIQSGSENDYKRYDAALAALRDEALRGK
jgi:ATP-dependent RNA helicase DDX51/DBP6